MTFDVIDAHCHVGIDPFGAVCDIKEYIKQATKIDIKKTLLIPVATQIIQKKDMSYLPCMREIEEWKIMYLRKETYNWWQKTIRNPRNPYGDVNEDLFKITRELNTSQNDVVFYNVPLLHPILDDKEETEKILKNEATCAVKIHGISTSTSTKNISKDLVFLLQKYDKQLIVHTDYYDWDPKNHFQKLKKENNPIDRVRFWIDNNLKLNIAHAWRLSKQAVRLAEWNKNISFWIGPDLLLWQEKESLYDKDDNVMKWCLDNIPVNQLLFDTDFWWNIYDRGKWSKRDRWSVDRLIYEWYKKGLNHSDLRSIFYENASRCFKIS